MFLFSKHPSKALAFLTHSNLNTLENREVLSFFYVGRTKVRRNQAHKDFIYLFLKQLRPCHHYLRIAQPTLDYPLPFSHNTGRVKGWTLHFQFNSPLSYCLPALLYRLLPVTLPQCTVVFDVPLFSLIIS